MPPDVTRVRSGGAESASTCGFLRIPHGRGSCLRADDGARRRPELIIDRLKDKLKSAIVVVGSVDEGKVRLAAGVTKDNIGTIKAGDLIKPIAALVGGTGGGRPDFAQAGGNKPDALDEALKSVPAWVAQQLGEAYV